MLKLAQQRLKKTIHCKNDQICQEIIQYLRAGCHCRSLTDTNRRFCIALWEYNSTIRQEGHQSVVRFSAR